MVVFIRLRGLRGKVILVANLQSPKTFMLIEVNVEGLITRHHKPDESPTNDQCQRLFARSQTVCLGGGRRCSEIIAES